MAVSMISMRTFDNSIVKLECHDRVESCQEIAREYAKEGYADKYAVISEYDYKLGGDFCAPHFSHLRQACSRHFRYLRLLRPWQSIRKCESALAG